MLKFRDCKLVRRNAEAVPRHTYSFRILGQVRNCYSLEYETMRLSIGVKRPRLCRVFVGCLAQPLQSDDDSHRTAVTAGLRVPSHKIIAARVAFRKTLITFLVLLRSAALAGCPHFCVPVSHCVPSSPLVWARKHTIWPHF